MGVLKKRTFDCINVDIDKDSNVCQESVTFIIPYLQRAYKWKEKQAKQMLEDFSEFLKQEKTYYCMQPLAVVKIGDNKYELLDGQQRLTTLLILWRILFESDEKTSYPYKFEYERDSSESNTLINRYSFITESDEIKKGEYGNIDEYYMSKVYGAIKLYFDNPNNKKTDEQKADNYKETFKKLLKGEGKHILFLWYEVNEEEKHTTFAHLNSGKIELTCSELIKAILLSDGNKDRWTIIDYQINHWWLPNMLKWKKPLMMTDYGTCFKPTSRYIMVQGWIYYSTWYLILIGKLMKLTQKLLFTRCMLEGLIFQDSGKIAEPILYV